MCTNCEDLKVDIENLEEDNKRLEDQLATMMENVGNARDELNKIII